MKRLLILGLILFGCDNESNFEKVVVGTQSNIQRYHLKAIRCNSCNDGYEIYKKFADTYQSTYIDVIRDGCLLRISNVSDDDAIKLKCPATHWLPLYEQDEAKGYTGAAIECRNIIEEHLKNINIDKCNVFIQIDEQRLHHSRIWRERFGKPEEEKIPDYQQQLQEAH